MQYVQSFSKFLIQFSFYLKLLNGAFDHFSKLWMGMKSELKAKEYNESQYFKFKPRLTKLDDIMEEDISALSELDSNEQMISDNSKIQLEYTEMVLRFYQLSAP